MDIVTSWRSMMVKMISIDSGMVVVIFISLMYMVLVFGLLFYVKNDWCDLLFKNFTVGGIQFFFSNFHIEKKTLLDNKIQLCLNFDTLLGKLGVSSEGVYQGETSKQ